MTNPTLHVDFGYKENRPMYIKRTIESAVLQGAQYFEVVAILGPRQSGKSTLAQTLFKNHTYVTLEDFDTREAAKRDPRSFLMATMGKSGIIIDEFQYFPELLSYIQTKADAEKINGYFILTGSQNFLMNQAITQSLAGRVSLHTLLPLSIEELKNSSLLPAEVEPLLFKGCYPAIYSKQTPPTLLYSNYLQTYIERDVRQLTQVGDLTTFQKFIRMCAARNGQLVNFTSIGNECDISDHTVKRWLSILEASYIVYLLRPYHTNFGKRLVKTPKLYFYDPGLVCHLLKINEDDIAIHPSRGALFESLIISDIIKWSYNHGIAPSVYFWRDKTGNEIDCIIDQGNNKLLAVEIKAGRTISQRFFKELINWQTLTESEQNSYIVYAGPEKQVRVSLQLLSWQAMEPLLTQLK